MRMNNQVYWSSVYCTKYNIYDRKSSLVWTFAKWKKTKQTNKIIPILVVNSENQMNVADYENKTIEKSASTQLWVVSVSQVEQPWFVHWATRNQMCMSRTHWVKFWEARVSTSPRVTQAMKPSLKCFRGKKVHCVFSKGKLCSYNILKKLQEISQWDTEKKTHSRSTVIAEIMVWVNWKSRRDHSLSGNTLGRG